MAASAGEVNRRDFCRQLAWGIPWLTFSFSHMPTILREFNGTDKKAQSGIATLRLQTSRLAELRLFYHKRFGFPILSETKDTVTLQAGATVLTFEQKGPVKSQFYHFAFNIPENKLSLVTEN